MAGYVVARWWNGSWGTLTRKDVYLEHDPDTGVYTVRWRGGQFFDRDGHYHTIDLPTARAAVTALLDTAPAQWRLQCFDPPPS